MALQTSGTISMNDINRDLKGYTRGSGTTISLGSNDSRKMAGGPTGPNITGPISMSDFYGDRSHVSVVVGTVVDDFGSYSTLTGGYIKDYYGSGSHLGSLSSEAGIYIPSSGDASNSLNEREVLALYTVYFNNSSIRDFYLKLAGQIYAQNTFTGIRELGAGGGSTGMGDRTLASGVYSSSAGNWDQWKWTSTSRWTFGTKYVHWY